MSPSRWLPEPDNQSFPEASGAGGRRIVVRVSAIVIEH
ncbi:unnamed protein product (plasmid) [Mycetohabitans rhizoxinica HKI 454]|uniref:Uncharacterized protein n=1 Tax=Mycetohabitans rhizoxinica (strain DSM 19002 / CIP 109453 / HKI 454) TaxID=882378 RepID=E5AUS9_MYCRK|nr:unnamed protein product [Mycetohabitans rhizoxinica HKI 454]